MYKDQIVKQLNAIMRNDPFILDLAAAEGAVLDSAGDLIDEFMLQLDVDTATWALAIYEKDLGLPTDLGLSLELRRAKIKFKQWASGVINSKTIELAAMGYKNGNVEVSFLAGYVTLKFSSTNGKPDFAYELKADLRNIIPAHLGINFSYKYLSYLELSEMTYEELEETLYKTLAGNGD
ncbi:putative phage tail protein [Paenibacillus sp. MAH-36]|uniref:Phage tail protein n=1 Tax=Paenibacillus violae TaxID=3077234 RepID=A0ABU3R8H8_9BACL|nr:putative phage tail protein [Paenibacillus sp. PFR10]MDU0200172.1 putative phage tail protein [Paenibacillus sp. PFR10]